MGEFLIPFISIGDVIINLAEVSHTIAERDTPTRIRVYVKGSTNAAWYLDPNQTITFFKAQRQAAKRGFIVLLNGMDEDKSDD